MRENAKRTCEFCLKEKSESNFDARPDDVQIELDATDQDIEDAHYCRPCKRNVAAWRSSHE